MLIWKPQNIFNFVVKGFLPLFFVLSVQPLFATQLDCAAILSRTERVATFRFEQLNGDFILVNGVTVTGEFVYPLDFALKNLGLDNTQEISSLRSKTVLSLGEGVSGLLPHLQRQGAGAKGVDLWYHSEDMPRNYSGDLMRDYIREHGDDLIQADARRIPMENNSVDVVVSHMLVNNVAPIKQRAIVREVIRILKNGGEARIFGFDEAETELIRKFLDTNFDETVGYLRKYLVALT